MNEEKEVQQIDLAKVNSDDTEQNNSITTMSNITSTNTNEKGIVVTCATAKWCNDQIDNTLEKVNLIIRPGRLVAIIGPVGAGKVYNYSLNY